MRFQYIIATCAALIITYTNAAPLANVEDLVGDGDVPLLDPRQATCPTDELSSKTWIDKGVDAFLANASQHYIQYPTNNIQALGAYLGAPNFFCGVGEHCNAGQPCTPVTLPGWYALMGIQGWNNYVNNINQAITYTAAILSLKLSRLVSDLWPKPKDNVTPMKMAISWINGILNAFPITAVVTAATAKTVAAAAAAAAAAGKAASVVTPAVVIGGTAAAVMGGNIIASGMMIPPSAGEPHVRWTAIADQMGTVIDAYKQSVGEYAGRIIDAPINEPQWGINSILKDGKYLVRDSNFTQNDIDNWMYQTIHVNAMGLILQAQNVFIYRVFNLTSCEEGHYSSAFYCKRAPNGSWTKYRLQKMGSDDMVPEHKLATKLQQTYNMTKEDIFVGPSTCLEENDYEQLVNPWENMAPDGMLFDPLTTCNFNLQVCTVDAADRNLYGKDEFMYYDNQSDWECELQGLHWY
ncbi:hypothetical protein C8035_v003121 [Colletotrichum spinosum]|uniref:DUF7872 domain-containing protein n=1 Tax=Colletotrichum spinosum TaxID=1347390 RepID=A0A4R8Q421_9PEZI|nr:hypothetical protein C8035_v003121 [Colletotrichum spinosum]